MDISLIVQQIVVPLVLILTTQGVKKVNSIPISDGQKARIRTFVGIGSFVLTALGAWATGDLDKVLSSDSIKVIVEAGVSFLLAHLGYVSYKKIEEKVD